MSVEVSKRQFLVGLLGATTAAAIPQSLTKIIEASPEAFWEEFFRNWQKAILPVHVDYMENILIYGVGALRYTDKYPFVESVHPRELYFSPTRGGLLDV